MTRVVVPVAILEGESVPYGLMDLLGTMDVTVLGYHVLPEQTPPDQARLQYEDRANEALADVAQEFRTAGGDADYRLVFTQDKEQSVQRVVDESQARAYTIAGATGDVDRILVPLSGDVAHERILAFVSELVGERDIGVTLLLVADDESTGSATLDEAAAVLAEDGLSVETKLALDTSPFEALMNALPTHDAIVMGEHAPTLGSFLFGEVTERVAAESVGPVLVVRREPEPDEAASEADD